MKYSKNFERDYNFYFSLKDNFTFCGTLTPKHKGVFDESGVDAKKAFFYIESNGKNVGCKEPELLNQLLLCKASVNFQIKEWAQGRADGTLPKVEFSEDCRIAEIEFFKSSKIDCLHLESIETIEKKYSLPKWVIDAVEKQKKKYLPEELRQYA